MKIGFIGIGNMGQAMVRGLLNSGEIAPDNIYVHGNNPDHYVKFANEVGVKTTDSNTDIVKLCDIIFLAVVPTKVVDVLDEIQKLLSNNKTLVSVAAGIDQDFLIEHAGSEAAVVRILPNVNVAINEGMTAISDNFRASTNQIDQVQEILNFLGKYIYINENDMTTFSAIAGSAPAFVYLFIDSLARAGVKHGLTRPKANAIVSQMVLGSAKMVQSSDLSPADLIDTVSSPGGTTVAGIWALINANMPRSIDQAVDATIKRDENLI